MPVRFRIEFTRDAVEERAPKDRLKGGFDRVPIPKGTVKEVGAASLNFWQGRGCVKLLGRVVKEPDPFERGAPPEVGFPLPVETPPQPQEFLSKGKLKGVFEAVLGRESLAEIKPLLRGLPIDQVEEYLADIGADSLMVLRVAIEDANGDGEVDGNLAEIKDVAAEALNALLPPSRRRKK